MVAPGRLNRRQRSRKLESARLALVWFTHGPKKPQRRSRAHGCSLFSDPSLETGVFSRKGPSGPPRPANHGFQLVGTTNVSHGLTVQGFRGAVPNGLTGRGGLALSAGRTTRAATVVPAAPASSESVRWPSMHATARPSCVRAQLRALFMGKSGFPARGWPATIVMET